MSRFRRAVELLARRGLAYPFYVLVQRFFPWQRAGRCTGAVLRRLERWFPATGRKEADVATFAREQAVLLSEWALTDETRKEIELARRRRDKEVVLARIDNDGRWLTPLGPLPGIQAIGSESFVERHRFDLDLVVEDGLVLVRKRFRGHRGALGREAAALRALAGEVGAPALYRVDEGTISLYKSFVSGPTLRDRLVDRGARILTVHTESDPELEGLTPLEKIEAVWARGRRVIEAAAPGLAGQLERLMNAIHRRGVTGFSLTFGNVVIDAASGEPWLIDFDEATTHRASRGLFFNDCRDRDRELFNRIYGGDLVTESTARELLAGALATNYAPVDLGRGLHTRGFWSTDSGSGRWEFLNQKVVEPWIKGRRVLDLGAHNGLMPLMMLRAGAREVIAFERDPEMVAAARSLQRVVEWRDLRSYALEVLCSDMRTILEQPLPSFDVVTAFCSLYYLAPEDMARVVRRAAELAPITIVQAKTDTRRQSAEGKAEKSSLEFLERLLVANGFPTITRVAPRGYSRPLLVGHRGRAAISKPSATRPDRLVGGPSSEQASGAHANVSP